MKVLIHHRRRRSPTDPGLLTVGATQYQLDERGMVRVTPEHAAAMLQGSMWREATAAEAAAAQVDVHARAVESTSLREQLDRALQRQTAMEAELDRLRAFSRDLQAVNDQLAARVQQSEARAQSLESALPAAEEDVPGAGLEVEEDGPTDEDAPLVDDLGGKTREELLRLVEAEGVAGVGKRASTAKLLAAIRRARRGDA